MQLCTWLCSTDGTCYPTDSGVWDFVWQCLVSLFQGDPFSSLLQTGLRIGEGLNVGDVYHVRMSIHFSRSIWDSFVKLFGGMSNVCCVCSGSTGIEYQ
jgi:hypothetical protein